MTRARKVELDGVAGVWVPLDDLKLLASAADTWNRDRPDEVGPHWPLKRVHADVADAILEPACPPVARRVLPAPQADRVMVDPATAGAAWGVTAREVTRRCSDGRIPGAIKLGSGRSGRWAVPLRPAASTNDTTTPGGSQ